jgi:hypothetical protein
MSDAFKRIHRFTNCEYFSKFDTVEFKHEHTTDDVRKITCRTCKERIVAVLFRRDWSKLVAEETAALTLAACEVEHP